MSFLLIGMSPKTLTYFGLHKHSSYEIILNTEGSGIAVIGEKEYPFCEGSIHIIPPNTPHIKRSKEGFRDIYIQSSAMPSLFGDLPTRHTICLDDDMEGSLAHLMKMMLYRYIGEGKNDSTLTLMYELFLQILSEKFTALHVDPIMESIRHNLALNFNDPELSLGSVLDDTGYNRDYARRRFTDTFGMSPGKYLTTLRIENAKRLLRQKDLRLSIADIGTMCGYYDGNYFSRIFKKQVGISAEAFAIESVATK